MNRNEWGELLLQLFLGLLTAYMRKHGEDAAQDVLSNTSLSLANKENPKAFKLTDLARVSTLTSDGQKILFPESAVPLLLDEKERFRLSQGTKS